MNRIYPDRPMVGVGAIIFRGGDVLLVKRGREPARGQWSLPGGLVELGESLQDAVSREVLEEVGLRVQVKNLVVVLDRVIRDMNARIEYHYVLLDFLCEYNGGEPLPGTDVTDCVFVSLRSLPEYGLTHGTEQVIRRSFAQREGFHYPVYDPGL